MALCINQSGTWRNINTQCVNQSGTWRKVATGCINQSGTWRKFGFGPPALGSSFGGGFVICNASSVSWIVAPNSSQVSRTWYCRNDAVIRAQQVSGCTGWFVPTCGQLQNPGYNCRAYWDSYASAFYWSSTESNSGFACGVNFLNGYAGIIYKTRTCCVRAFRCVTY